MPVITSVLDVGNDQGRQVRIRWLRSLYDAEGSSPIVTAYVVYRWEDQYRMPPEVALGSDADPFPGNAGNGPSARLDGWDEVGTAWAASDSAYQLVVPTLCDSTPESGICWSTFMVRAMTDESWVHYESRPDSGYSVDNLAPAAPARVMAEDGGDHVLLTWDENEEEDLDYYAVYRGTEESFNPVDPIGYSTVGQFADTSSLGSGIYWYKITAWDLNGNESDPSDPAPVGPTGVNGSLPTRFHLGRPVPNPFAGVASIQYSIPSGAEGARAALRIYDPAGRLVRELVSGSQTPGVHWATWDGRDERGVRAASGVYFCRMEAGGFTASQKLMLLR